MDDLFPDPAQKQFVLTLGALATQGTIQIAFVVFGYLSYKDFGWRIFKLFGTDLGMRQVYETYLWFKALLKMDALLAGLNVAAGFAFFYFKEGESWRVVMIVGVGANLLWVCLAFAAVKLEKSLLVRVLMPPALTCIELVGEVEAAIGHELLTKLQLIEAVEFGEANGSGLHAVARAWSLQPHLSACSAVERLRNLVESLTL